MRYIVPMALLLALTSEVFAMTTPIALEVQREGDAVLVDLSKAAQAAGWEAKVVTPGKLVTLCRDTLCVPLQLEGIAHKEIGGALHADGVAVARALGCSFQAEGGTATLTPLANPGADLDVPAYHAAWGKQRGFAKGQVVPDIPLYDMNGKEVRFSQFLGKQYLIYIWGSW